MTTPEPTSAGSKPASCATVGEHGSAFGSIFISYGREDASTFADRLAADLEKRGGYQVWIDRKSIPPVALFDVRIEHGIRESSVVAAVMTRQALRDESFCRKELIFAHNEGKPIVPLRCDPDPDLKPSLLLCQLNSIDFTQDYERAFFTLLRYLSSGDVSVLEGPPIPTVTGVSPFDFGPEIARFFTGFTGREWLNRALDHWLTNPNGRAFVIIGEPGIGKSAIAAWLSQTRHEQIVGIHFCTHRNTRTLNPFEFVASLVSQLSTQVDGYAEAVKVKDPARRRRKASDAFRELVVEPVRTLSVPSDPRVIIVDSLDEAMTGAKPGEETVVDVLANQAEDLPPWLRIVATTRPEDRVLQRTRRLSTFELSAERRENVEDVGRYIETRLQVPGLSQCVQADPARIRNHLEELAEGNFLYARMAMDAMEEGTLTATDLGRLTPGLANFYAAMFSRTFSDLDVYGRDYLPVLKALAVACGPMSFSLLERTAQVPPEALHRRLLKLKPYLRVTGQGTTAEYSLFHKSLPDWLTTAELAGEYWCEPVSGHRIVADILFGRWRDDEYALRHLPAHLSAAGDWERLTDVLSDTAFVVAKCGAGMICDLAGDLSTAWKAGKLTEGMSLALVQMLEAQPCQGAPVLQPSENLRQQLRGSLNEFFGHYADWPPSLRRSLEDSDSTNVMLFLGDTHDMENRYTDSERLFRKMKKRASEAKDSGAFATACVRLAFVLEHQHRLKEGLEELDLIVSDADTAGPHEDGYWWAQHHRAILLRRLFRYAEAIDVLKQIHSVPEGPGLRTSAWHQLGIIDLELGNLKAAEEKFTECLRRRGEAKYDHRRAYEPRRLAQVYALTGRLDEARLAFDQAHKISQDSGNWRYVEQIREELIVFIEAPQLLLKERPETASKKEVAARFGIPETSLVHTFHVLQGQNLGDPAQDVGYVEVVGEESGTPTGKIARWDIVHQEGLWHGSVLVLIVNDGGDIALQCRHERDSEGKWDVSVAGHQDVGETDWQAAVRETMEEVGLPITPERLRPLGAAHEFRKVGTREIAQDLHEGPFSYLYHTHKNNRERSSAFVVRLTPGENLSAGGSEKRSHELQWMPLAEAVQWANAKPSEFASGFKQLLHPVVLQRIADIIRGKTADPHS